MRVGLLFLISRQLSVKEILIIHIFFEVVTISERMTVVNKLFGNRNPDRKLITENREPTHEIYTQRGSRTV